MTPETVIEAMRKIRELDTAETKRHKEAVWQLKNDARHIQALCPHPKWIHVPDASGNNGSWDYCETCGLET